MRRRLAWLLVAPVALWTVVRLLGLERGYPLAPFMAFTPFVLLASFGVVAVAAALRARAAAAAALVVAATLTVILAPRALGGPSGARGGSGTTIAVLSVNLRKGEADPEAIVALARRVHADVLSLQEVSYPAIDGLREAGLDQVLPHAVIRKGTRRETDGTALFATVPLRALPVTPGTWNPAARAIASFGGTPVDLTAVHPPAPVSGERVRAWRHDLRALPVAGDELRILVGDFNATLDHRELRRLIGTGYEDAADEVGAGFRPTWPVGGRPRPPITIDHVLADARCGFASVSVTEIPRTDHRAVLARVVLPRTPG